VTFLTEEIKYFDIVEIIGSAMKKASKIEENKHVMETTI